MVVFLKWSCLTTNLILFIELEFVMFFDTVDKCFSFFSFFFFSQSLILSCVVKLSVLTTPVQSPIFGQEWLLLCYKLKRAIGLGSLVVIQN